MHLSPLVLLRQPIYTLSHLEAFALDLAESEPTEEDIEVLRLKFLDLIQSKHLLLSLPFSSKAVYSAIAHYEFHASVKIRKKEKQSERAFMKYLQRMTLNCSPLANFAGSQFCDWTGALYTPEANFRLDLALAQRKEFFDLCYCDQGLQGIMRHRLNPSLRFTGDGFTYIYSGGEGESEVQIETSSEFEELYHAMKDTDFTFAEFVEYSDFDVNEFLEAQLITPSYPTYGDSKIIKEIVASILERYQIAFSIDEIIGKNYAKLSDKEVTVIQSNWINKINSYAKKLNVTLNDKVYPERVFYLNTALKDTTKPEFDRDLICAELMGLINIIRNAQIEEKGDEVLEDLNQAIAYPVSQYAYDQMKLNPIAESASLEFKIDTASSRIPPKYTEPVGVMLQHTKEGKPNLINVTTAYGKFFAPALPLASQEVKDLIQDWVEEDSNNKLALKDASLHSKNKSHSYLQELDNFGLDYHTAIAERVRVKWEKGNLINDANEETIEVVNLGIEDLTSRSPLLQNLQKLNSSLPNIPEFIDGLQEAHLIQLEGGIAMKPQIETAHLILGYASWILTDAQQFPERSNDLVADIFIYDVWRQNLNMPRVVSYSFDDKKSNYLDFYNPWSVDIFLRSIKNMESKCTLTALGLPEKIKGVQLVETYFEFKASQ